MLIMHVTGIQIYDDVKVSRNQRSIMCAWIPSDTLADVWIKKMTASTKRRMPLGLKPWPAWIITIAK